MLHLLPILAGWATTLACAHELSLDALQTEVADLRELAITLDVSSQEASLLPTSRLQAEYDDAIYRAMIGDTDLAAERLWLIRSALPADEPLLAQVDETLSQCLLDLGSWTLADRVLEQMLSDDHHPFLGEAAHRRLELYAEYRSPEAFAALYTQLEARGLLADPAPALAYGIGRARWMMGDLLGADAMFAAVPPGGKAWWMARYHRGVLAVATRDFPAALEQFEAISAMAPANPVERHVRDLGILGVARLQYEKALLDEAAATYSRIGDDSPVLAEALEELAWTEIRRGFPDGAVAAVEHMSAAFPDHPSSARMRVLLGHLQMSLGRWSDAEAAYADALSNLDRLGGEVEDSVGAAAVTDPSAVHHAPWVLEALREDGGVLRAIRLHRTVQTDAELLLTAEAAADAVSAALDRSPVLARHQEHLGDAVRALARVAALRLRIAGVEASISLRRSRRDLETRIREAARLRPPGETTAPWVRANLDRSRVLADQARRERSPEEQAHHGALDALYATLGQIEGTLDDVVRRVEAEMAHGDTPVHRELARQQAELRDLRRDHELLRPRADRLLDEAVAVGVEAVRNDLSTHQRAASSGLVDASWLQLEDVRQARSSAADRRIRALAQLEQVFDSLEARADFLDGSAEAD